MLVGETCFIIFLEAAGFFVTRFVDFWPTLGVADCFAVWVAFVEEAVCFLAAHFAFALAVAGFFATRMGMMAG